MDTVYNVHMTTKAGRGWKFFHEVLYESLPPEERKTVKIMTTILDLGRGHLLHPQTTGGHRYIHIVIDIQKGKLQNNEEKQAFLQRTVDACRTYEGKYVEDCEIEVKLNEVDNNDYMRVWGSKRLA